MIKFIGPDQLAWLAQIKMVKIYIVQFAMI